MASKQVFVVCERTFTHQDDEGGSLSIESIHTTLESANRWAQALANNRYEENEDCAERNHVKGQRNTKWGKLFAETITTPAEDNEFAITYSVEMQNLEGDELAEDNKEGSAKPVAAVPIEIKAAFVGMKFSWVGELDDMEARDEIRYLVFDNGGAWQGIEKCLEESISDYVIAGKNVSQRHQQIIEDKDLPCLNRQAFLRMVKNLGLPISNPQEAPINSFKCFARMNFTVLGSVEDPADTKILAAEFGAQPRCSYTSQMDYVVRRGGDSPADLQLFAEECRKFLKINNPTVITSKELVEMILKKVVGRQPAENPRLVITRESIKIAHLCLDGIKFSIPTGETLIDDTNVQNVVRNQGGQVLGSIHAMDLADYVVTGTGGLSAEHAAMTAQFDVKVITIVDLRALITRLMPWKTAKDMLGVAMGYLHYVEPKTRKRKSQTTSIGQPSRKSAKLAA